MHPPRNVLTRALGVGEFVQVDAIRVVLRKGDRVLLCSDGLYGQVSHVAMASMLQRQSLKRAANELVRSAKRAGGDDNIAVIATQMDSATQVAPTQPEDVTEHPRRNRPPLIAVEGFGVLIAILLFVFVASQS